MGTERGSHEATGGQEVGGKGWALGEGRRRGLHHTAPQDDMGKNDFNKILVLCL